MASYSEINMSEHCTELCLESSTVMAVQALRFQDREELLHRDEMLL